MRRTTAELRLVANLARLHHEDPEATLAPQLSIAGLAWERVLSLAQEHGVVPLIHESLRHMRDHALPDGIEARLRDLRAQSVARDLARYHQWSRICAAFTANDVEAVTIRGFHVALAVYGQRGLRPVRHLDFVVRPDDRAAVQRLLKELGLADGVRLHAALGAASSPLLADELLDAAVPFESADAAGVTALVLPPELALLASLLDEPPAGAVDLQRLVDIDEALAQLTAAQRARTSQYLERVHAPRALWEAQEALASLREPQVFSAAARKRKAAAAGETQATFVTAIYDSDEHSLLGGRGRGLDHYLASLANIANLGAPLIVYCAERDVDSMTRVLGSHFNDLRVIAFELAQFPMYERFLAFKQSYVADLDINLRNEVLCFQKSYWLADAVARNPFGHQHFYWIDAGLTHHGIFPESVGGVELLRSHPETRYFPEDAANIFRPALGQALVRNTAPDRVFFCALPELQSRTPRDRLEQVVAAHFGRAREDLRIKEHLVGGLFGGRPPAIAALHRHFVALLEACIVARVPTLEEQLFSAIHAVHPELFALQRFGTWQFFAPGQPNSRLTSEGDSFYKIFSRLASSG